MHAGSPESMNIPAIVFPVVLAIVVIVFFVVLAIVVIVWSWFKVYSRAPVIIKFSIKNESGSLAKTLKVFEVSVKKRNNE